MTMPDMPDMEAMQTGGFPTPDGATDAGTSGGGYQNPMAATCQQIPASDPFPGSSRPSD